MIQQTREHGDAIRFASRCRGVEGSTVFELGTMREKKLDCIQRGMMCSYFERKKAASVGKIRVRAVSKKPTHESWLREYVTR